MTLTQSLVVGFRAAKEARKTAKPAGQGLIAGLFKNIGLFAGLTLISAAGLIFNIEVGLVVAGLSCLYADWLASS